MDKKKPFVCPLSIVVLLLVPLLFLTDALAMSSPDGPLVSEESSMNAPNDGGWVTLAEHQVLVLSLEAKSYVKIVHLAHFRHNWGHEQKTIPQ
ncbi:MAG: hypothetical protein KAX26_18315 [Anaerolineae bacterium]|nr:hypothetical protein [Anaerolineae bacterium]